MISDWLASSRSMALALVTMLVCALVGVDHALAQGAPPNGADIKASDRAGAAAVDANATPDTAEQRARAEIETAYQQEYAFLVGQKRELQARVVETRARARAEVAQTRQRIDSLQGAVLALGADAKTLTQRIDRFQRRGQAARHNAAVLTATFEQAAATLGEHGRDFMHGQSFAAREQPGKLAAVFTGARGLLSDLTAIREAPGMFYSVGGRKVEGTLIRVGDIATYGVAGDVAGALAPAGGGELKVWAQSDGADARAVAEGRAPEELGVFLYESLQSAVPDVESEGVIAHIRSGGLIAWVIVALGALALLLVLARMVLLWRSGAGAGRLIKAVSNKMQQGDIDGALSSSRRRKGSAATVVAAALANIDRDRDQLEDILDEALLNESTKLERFGSLILVISAVSPLLGLLGTVIGMISTFEVITEFGTGDPSLLAGGIAIALVNTELGLAVAIPALLVGHVLSGWADRIKDDTQKAALRVINLHEDQHETAVRQAA